MPEEQNLSWCEVFVRELLAGLRASAADEMLEPTGLVLPAPPQEPAK